MYSMESIVDDYETFFQENYQKVVRYLSGRCKSFHDAEDIANDSFLYCLTHWDEYDPNKATRKTWLYIVVRSRWKNHLRNHKTYSDIDELEGLFPDVDIIEQTTWLQSIRDELAVLLERLPENQREAIVLRYIEQWSDDEIARVMNTNRVNVRVMIHRGLQRMNNEFSEYLRKVLL